MTSIGRKMFSGAIWMTLLNLLERSIALISTLILVRLLAPEDFGIIAMAMVFVQGLELLTAFGFDVVLIQKQKATRVHYDTAWTLKIGFGALSAVLLYLIAPFAADFYAKPELTLIVRVLAAGFLIRSLENIAIVDFRKLMLFHKDFYLRLSVKIVGFMVTIPLAFQLRSYWALIFGVLATNLATLVFSFIARPYRPRLTLAAGREIFSFSSWLMANNVIFFLRNKLPDLVTGRILGAQALGIFAVALEIATVTTIGISAAVNRAVFPGYAKLSTDDGSFDRTVREVTGAMSLFAFPVAFGMIATADLFVPLVLGEKWTAVIPVIQLLALYGMIGACTSNWIYVFNALARPQLATQVGVFQVLLMIPVLFLCIRWFETPGVAAAVTIIAAVTVPLMMWMLSRVAGVSALGLCRATLRPFAASLIMFALTFAFVTRWRADFIATGEWLHLGLAIALGVSVYVVSLFLLWICVGKPEGPEAWSLRLLRSRTSST